MMPGPVTEKFSMLSASGTTAPAASTTATLKSATSCPSAAYVGEPIGTTVTCRPAGAPVVATVVVATTLPLASYAVAEILPGANGTLGHEVTLLGATVLRPRLAPLTNASTAAAPVYARSVIGEPTGTGAFQSVGTSLR
jgi:hypothetical protein